MKKAKSAPRPKAQARLQIVFPTNASGLDISANEIMVTIVGQLIGMKYSRADETEADWLGVSFMNDSGYDPQDMVKVMQIQADIQNMDQCL
jgi:predicted Zn-dependent protease